MTLAIILLPKLIASLVRLARAAAPITFRPVNFEAMVSIPLEIPSSWVDLETFLIVDDRSLRES